MFVFLKLLAALCVIFLVFVRCPSVDKKIFIDSFLEENETNQTYFKNFSQAFSGNYLFDNVSNLYLEILSENNIIETKIVVDYTAKIKYYRF